MGGGGPLVKIMTARFIAILLWLFLAHQQMTGGSHCAYCWLLWFCCTGHSMLAQSFSPLLLVQLVHPSQHSVWISNISLFLQFYVFLGEICVRLSMWQLAHNCFIFSMFDCSRGEWDVSISGSKCGFSVLSPPDRSFLSPPPLTPHPYIQNAKLLAESTTFI